MAFSRSGSSSGSRGGSRGDSRNGGPRSFGGSRGGDRGSSYGGGGFGGAPKSFDVTCARCGIETTVPFKPTGEKPVLCRNCFNNPDGAAPARRAAPGAGSMQSRGGAGPSSADLQAINDKLDRIMAAMGIDGEDEDDEEE